MRYNNLHEEHVFNKDDAKIALFFNLYGTNGLSITNSKDLAQRAIGVTEDSLKMHSANIKSEMGFGGLKHSAKILGKVYNDYLKKPYTYDEFKEIINNIIDHRDLDQIESEFREIDDALEILRKNSKNGEKITRNNAISKVNTEILKKKAIDDKRHDLLKARTGGWKDTSKYKLISSRLK
jgi:hypothetical protein